MFGWFRFQLAKTRVVEYLFPLLLFLICVFIINLNHVPRTYLSGWDTLHPEFNFSLAFERIVFGVFRTDQGLGAVAAHSHMADLPRVVLLFLSSVLLPPNLLRFSFIALCLPIGVLGCYFFILNILLDRKSERFSKAAAFLGALFYLFNLGTLQQFYVPFEMFTVQYALLPWLFLTATNYLKNPTKKNLIWFSITTLLSTPMAYAATLWYAYFLILILYLLLFIKKRWRGVIAILSLTLLINSLWLLPNLYFIFSGNAALVPEARINKIFSQEAFIHNQSYGDIQDSIVFKNFLFDWQIYTGNNQFDYLLRSWNSYLSNPWIKGIGYLSAVFVIAGIAYAFFKKNLYGKALFLPGLISLIFIINLNPPFAFIFDIFRENFPIFKEALRFPFDKFSIILVFIFSCFFSLGQTYLIKLWEILSKKFSKRSLSSIFIPLQIIISCTLLIIYMFPFFQGELISKSMQVKIPPEYFQLFDFLNKQPNDYRVAELPLNSFWGWTYYNWGFQGAQFISFGIKQPLLDRDYDRWNPSNEQYYREISAAVYSQNIQTLAQVLEKYNVHYLLLDKNVISPDPSHNTKVLFFDEITSLLSNSPQIRKVKQFNDLYLYEYLSKNNSDKYIKTPNAYTLASSTIGPTNTDWIYENYGDYLLTNKSTSSLNEIYFPFNSLIDNQNIADQSIISVSNDQIGLKTDNLPSKANLNLGNYLKDESSIPAEVYLKQERSGFSLKFSLNILSQSQSQVAIYYHLPYSGTNNNLVININQFQTLTIKDVNSKDYIDLGQVFLSTSSYNNIALYKVDESKQIKSPPLKSIQFCNEPSSDEVIGASNLPPNGVAIIAKNAQACIKVPLREIVSSSSISDFKSLLGLNFSISSKDGLAGHYCIFDDSAGRCIQEERSISTPTNITDYFTVAPDDPNRLELVLYLDGINNQQVQEIDYNNLSTSLRSPVSVLSISPDDLEKSLSGSNTVINPTKTLFLNYKNDFNQRFNIFDKSHTSSDCSSILPKSYSRTINQNFIEYSSLNGSSCDFYSFPDLPHNVGYLISIDSQNVTGLPLRVCVANNYTRRCDLYLTLPANKNFQKQMLLVPPANDGGVGYDIHLDNYAAGRVPSTNRIEDIEMSPFPYNFVTSLGFAPTSFKTNITSLKLVSLKEFLPNFYLLSYINSANSEGLIVLNKSYDRGWVMFGGNHLIFDGWANGWLMKANSKGYRLIVYLPQLLEFAGLLILICLLSLLALGRPLRSS